MEDTIMRIAQVLYNKAHYIFEADEIPNYPPDPEGNPIVLIDISNNTEIQEGWDFDVQTKSFKKPILQEDLLDDSEFSENTIQK